MDPFVSQGRARIFIARIKRHFITRIAGFRLATIKYDDCFTAKWDQPSDRSPQKFFFFSLTWGEEEKRRTKSSRFCLKLKCLDLAGHLTNTAGEKTAIWPECLMMCGTTEILTVYFPVEGKKGNRTRKQKVLMFNLGRLVNVYTCIFESELYRIIFSRLSANFQSLNTWSRWQSLLALHLIKI